MQPKRLNACALATEYVSLVKAYWTHPLDPCAPPLDPAPLRASLSKLNRGLSNRKQQHDAHEAMMAVIQGLHSALSKTGHVRDSLTERDVDLPAWRAHNKNNYSLLTEIFQGQTRVDVTGEGYESTTYEHFWDLSLAIDGNTGSVQSALARHFENQSVDGYKHGDGYVRVDIARRVTYCPLILIVHLKRFDNRRKKIDKFVDYAVELTVPTLRGAGRYALFAVCLHAGDCGAGHYAAMCEVRGRWFYVDDANVRDVQDVNAIIQKDAYVLLYRKVLDF
jgi:ubiquitin C-terminal hydrolase